MEPSTSSRTDHLPTRVQARTFIWRAGSMIALLAVIHSGYTWWMLNGAGDASMARDEVRQALERSLKKAGTKIKKLLMGDSVAKQLYPQDDYKDSLYSLTCNQAISLAGQYILLDNFLKNNPPDPADPYTVTLIYHPQSFDNNLDQVYTFGNFLKHFDKRPFKQAYTPFVERQLAKIPYRWMAQVPYIRITHWAPQMHNNTFDRKPAMAEVSREYLPKIAQRCAEAGVRFRISPPLISEGKAYKLDSIKNSLERYPELKPYFKGYFEAVRFLPNMAFVDSIHLNKPKLKRNPLGL